MGLISSLVGCAGESSNSNPPATPADGVDFKFNAPDEETPEAKRKSSEEAESKDVESTKPDGKGSMTTKSESSGVGPPDKHCPTLATKAKCEIALGCAWHTDKKCVAQ